MRTSGGVGVVGYPDTEECFRRVLTIPFVVGDWMLYLIGEREESMSLNKVVVESLAIYNGQIQSLPKSIDTYS